jgi:hypothetical protein
MFVHSSFTPAPSSQVAMASIRRSSSDSSLSRRDGAVRRARGCSESIEREIDRLFSQENRIETRPQAFELGPTYTIPDIAHFTQNAMNTYYQKTENSRMGTLR